MEASSSSQSAFQRFKRAGLPVRATVVGVPALVLVLLLIRRARR